MTLAAFRFTIAVMAGAMWPGMLNAQPADLPIPAATTSNYPQGVRIVKSDAGPAYGDAAGLTLYGLDMRTLLRAGPDPAQYCTGKCAADWVPMLAPTGATPNIQFPQGGGPNAATPAGFVRPQLAPDWTVIKGPQGPQWVYKGWHLVFTRKGDRPGAATFDGAENRSWNILRFVPPVPVIVAPVGVRPLFSDGAYTFADREGHILFTGDCAPGCPSWKPFAGGLASAGIGAWRVNTDGDTPQWTYRGAWVYIGGEGNIVPDGGKALRP